MKRDDILLGITKEKEIAFCDIDIRDNEDGSKELSACFSCVRPFINEDTDGEQYAQEILDSCYTKEDLYDLCEQYDCKPSELASEYAYRNDISTLADTYDCSLYSNSILIDGDEWRFESSSAGQHDIGLGGMLEAVNKQAFYTIYTAWKQYHLKAIPQEEEQKVLQAIEALDLTYEEEEAKITSYIEKYIKEQ